MKSKKKAVPLSAELQKELMDAYQLLNKAEFQRSEQLLLKVLAQAPKNYDANFMLGIISKQFRAFDAARKYLEKAIKVSPKMPAAYNELGEVFKSTGKLTQAIWNFNKAINLDPKRGLFHNNLATALMDKGNMIEARSAYAKAIKSGFYSAYSNLLLLLNYGIGLDKKEVYKLHCGWNDFYQSQEGYQSKSFEYSFQHQKIRVGYVSPDFNLHSVAYFFEPLLDHLDRTKFEIYCYYAANMEDEVTHRFMEKSDHWRSISTLNDIDAAERIYQDEIDILVDLSGHTGGNRLGIFSIKPAPVQVTWLGYPNTTGLKTIDFRLSDEIADPVEKQDDDYYSEKLVRLPAGFLCYRGDGSVEPATQPPCVEQNRITFGSFNNLRKVTDEVIQTWAEILKRVPDSQLLIKSFQFSFDEIKQGVIKKFNVLGIKRNRLILMEKVDQLDQHLQVYNQIDIALDTFPYNGTTTTCEALWMGVPTVALAGDCHASRVSASILSHANMSEFVASDIEHYIQKAVDMAQDTKKLVSIRQNIRAILSESPLCDEKAFTESMEAFYSRCIEAAQQGGTGTSEE